MAKNQHTQRKKIKKLIGFAKKCQNRTLKSIFDVKNGRKIFNFFFPLSMLILGQKNLAFQNPPSLKFHNRTDNNVQLPNTSRFQKMLSHETQAFKTAQNGALLNGANLSLIFAIFLSYSSLRQNDRNQFQNYRSILSRVSIFEFR